MLKQIRTPHDVAKLNKGELIALSQEIREIIIDAVEKNGGHLSSNLGVVELTVALNYVFDQESDQIIFDVGHQCYAHKLLTGRVEEFISSLRVCGGLSGFPNISESKYDLLTVGHGGSTVSQGAGLAKARDIKGANHDVISVIGDASFASGVSLEALNNAGESKQIIILNDNKMAISESVGGISRLLTKLRDGKASIGADFASVSGFRYVGPIDGHDFDALIPALIDAKQAKDTVLLHVVTQKGRGHDAAEADPCTYHGVKPVGAVKPTTEDFSSAFGRILTEFARRDDKIVAICPAMVDNTGLAGFAKAFPDRVIDVGISEEHAVSYASGLSKGGCKPYLAIYSTFLQRSYDEILHDVVMQGLPVTFCVDRAGLVGEDGETHHGIFDLAMFESMPGVAVLSPSTVHEFEQMMEFSLTYNKPLAIRYCKGTGLDMSANFEFGKWQVVSGDIGANKVVLSHGASVLKECVSAARDLENVAVINCSTVSPLDEEMLLSLAQKEIFVYEDVVDTSCLGARIINFFASKNIKANVHNFNLGATFVPHGKISDLLKKCNLDAGSIKKELI